MSDMRLIKLPRLTLGSLLLFVITIVSAGLSAYCGWMLAHGTNVLIQICSAAAGGSIALLLAMNTEAAAHAYASKDTANYKRLMGYCLLLAVFNWVTDFGAASVLRDATNVASQNVNTVADQKRGEVDRIERRLQELDGILRRQRDIKDPGHYQNQLLVLKSTLGADGRNIWQRSRECADVTVKESQDHCAEIGQAKQMVAQAQTKRRLEDERLTLTQSLPQAKLESQQHQAESNPVVAQVSNVLSVVFRTFQHTDGTIKGGVLGFTLLWTAMFSMIIYMQSWNAGLAKVTRPAEPNWADNWQLPDARPEAPAATQAGQNTIILQSETVRQDQATEALELALQRLNQRFKRAA